MSVAIRKTVQSARSYEYGEIEGTPIYIASHFRQLDGVLLDHCLDFIAQSLADLSLKVPPPAWAKINRVPVWLEYEDALLPTGCYHESEGWVVAHGYEPAKAGCIQLTKRVFERCKWEPMLVLHELAHFYHHKVLSYDDPTILAAFDRAKASGLYANVRRNSGEIGPAYAMVNHKEFFCELSEAYFGENDFPPFTRTELEALDPDSFEVIAQAWNRS